ncbi:MAG: HAD family hydrolase [Acetivibrionales bacterium]
MKYKHIIWDWNGTLLNDTWLSVEIINSMLACRGLKCIDCDKYREIFDFPVYEYYARLGMDYCKERFEDISDQFTNQYNKRWRECSLQEGAREVLQAVSFTGATQSVLSASHIDILQENVEYYKLDKYLIKLVGLDHSHADSKVGKGRQWIKELGLAPEKVLLIGDTVHDFEVANAIGVDCMLVSHGHHSAGKLERCGVKVVESLLSILE